MAAKYNDLLKRMDEVEEKIEGTSSFDPLRHNSETRSKIANKFVQRFFWIIVGGVLSILIYNLLIYFSRPWIGGKTDSEFSETTLDLVRILPILISAVSSPLGFVVGYYFKSESSRNN